MRRTLAIGTLVAMALGLGALGVRAFRPAGNPGPPIAAAPVDHAALRAIEPDLELAEGGGPRRNVVFGRRVGSPAIVDFRATIVIFEQDRPYEVLVPGLEGHLWVYAGRSADGRTIWALADNAVESPGWTLELVTTEDGGKTWRHLASIPKPYYWATFESFRMGPTGEGAVTVRLDAPAPPNDDGTILGWLRSLVAAEEHPDGYTEADEQPAGLYVYRTDDGGLTWSGPAFFADDTESAWEVNEGDHPEFGPPDAGAAWGGAAGDGWGVSSESPP